MEGRGVSAPALEGRPSAQHHGRALGAFAQETFDIRFSLAAGFFRQRAAVLVNQQFQGSTPQSECQ